MTFDNPNICWHDIDYEFPVKADGVDVHTRELLRIREDWLDKLTTVSELSDVDDWWLTRIKDFTTFLLNHQLNFKGSNINVIGAWCIPEEPRMPSDARVDFLYMPTYLAVSWLSLIKQRYPEIAELFPEFDEAFKKGLNFASNRYLQGHGYDAVRESLIAINYLAMGNTFEFVRNHPEYSVRFISAVKKAESIIVDRLQDNENWFGIDPVAAENMLNQLRCATNGCAHD